MEFSLQHHEAAPILEANSQSLPIATLLVLRPCPLPTYPEIGANHHQQYESIAGQNLQAMHLSKNESKNHHQVAIGYYYKPTLNATNTLNWGY
ncbi:hypothetical protein V6N13_097469 [Hibiscus sabdariffa]|uniref:Uncharacterized protein n=2 Tax=Hibiscus sabdariffa TaxID=183260 RepID=A0ABR2PCR3_9ROSI